MALRVYISQNENEKVGTVGNWYARVDNLPPIEIDELADLIKEHNIGFSKGSIVGILKDMVTIIRRQVLNGQQTTTGYALTITTSGTGTATVTSGGNAVSSGSSLNEDAEVEISITPAEGKTPTASVNGSDIELTENDGTYTGSFAMPGQASTLLINTGTADSPDNDDDGLDKD